MINIRKALICVAAAAIAAVSCQKDDTLSYNNMTMGNIVNGKFVSDQGNTFNIIEQLCTGKLEDEKRAMVICDVLNETEGASGEYDVRLTNFAHVLDKDAVRLEDAVEGDIITQNPINIEQLWFSGGYANMLISYYVKPGSETKHLVNLVYSKDDKGRYILNFRHNGFGEVLTQENASQMMLGNAYVSFPLSKFITEDNAKLVLTWKWYKSIDSRLDLNTITDYTFEYEWKRSGFEHKF